MADKPEKKVYDDRGTIELPQVKVEVAVAKDDARWYLQWPFLDRRDPSGAVIVATNGHMLIAVPVTISGDVAEGPLPLDAFKYARTSVDLTLHFKKDMVGTKAAMFARPAYDFTYPDWRRILPETGNKEGHDVGFDGTYLATLQDALNGGLGKGMRVYLPRKGTKIEPHGPVTFRSGSGLEGVAALMPMRI